MSGKPVFLALDPSSQYFKRQTNPQQQMMGQPAQNVSSDLPTLLNAYGITYDPQKVVGDLENATQVQTGAGGVARYPIWLSLRKNNFSPKSIATAQLSSAMFIEAGSLAQKSGSTLTFTPLVETSASSGDIASMMLQFAQPDDVAKQITQAARKRSPPSSPGNSRAAFPDGAPSDDPKPDESAKKDDKKPEAAKAADALKESKTTSTLFVIADTDWLFDDYSVRKFNFFVRPPPSRSTTTSRSPRTPSSSSAARRI